MDSNMTAALHQLNAAHASTGHVYAVEQLDDTYALVMPNGGRYPVVGAHDMLVRITNLRIAAEGRGAR